jgi:hypothetical protein
MAPARGRRTADRAPISAREARRFEREHNLPRGSADGFRQPVICPNGGIREGALSEEEYRRIMDTPIRHVHTDFEEFLAHVRATGGTDEDIAALRRANPHAGTSTEDATITALREVIARAGRRSD